MSKFLATLIAVGMASAIFTTAVATTAALDEALREFVRSRFRKPTTNKETHK